MPVRIPVGSPPSEISVGRTCPKPIPPAAEGARHAEGRRRSRGGGAGGGRPRSSWWRPRSSPRSSRWWTPPPVARPGWCWTWWARTSEGRRSNRLPSRTRGRPRDRPPPQPQELGPASCVPVSPPPPPSPRVQARPARCHPGSAATSDRCRAGPTSSSARTGRWSDPACGNTSAGAGPQRPAHQDVVDLAVGAPGGPGLAQHRPPPAPHEQRDQRPPGVHVPGQHGVGPGLGAQLAPQLGKVAGRAVDAGGTCGCRPPRSAFPPP